MQDKLRNMFQTINFVNKTVPEKPHLMILSTSSEAAFTQIGVIIGCTPGISVFKPLILKKEVSK